MPDENALYQHLRDKHKGPAHGKKAEIKRQKFLAHQAVEDEREPSMADLMVEAQIARACGQPVDPWTEAVFGDYID